MDYLKYMHFEKEDMGRYASDCDCDECEIFRNSFEEQYEYMKKTMQSRLNYIRAGEEAEI